MITALSLAACGPGPDQPDNIPLVGEWLDKSELVAVEVTGMPVDIEDLPNIPAMKKINKSEKYCGEPSLRTKEDFQQQLDRSNALKCKISEIEDGERYATVSGTCNAFGKSSISQEAYFSGKSSIAEEKITYEYEVETVITSDDTGEGESVTIYIERTMTRLGDC